MGRERADVVVVGGSVAGAATALGLARRGHRVIVADRATFPREKPCGEGLMPHGRAALARLGVVVEGSPFVGIRYAIGDAVAEGRFPDGAEGLGVRRRDLDALLVETCTLREIDVRTGVRVRGLAGGAGDWTVRTDQGELRARAVVGADGLGSPCRRWLGLDVRSRGRARYGVRRHFRLAEGVSEGRFVEVHVVPDRGIELYLTPTGPGEINVALLLEKDEMAAFRGDPDGGFDQAVRSCPAVAERVRGAVPVSEVVAVGPLSVRSRRGYTDGALLVGDAAGFLDAITGEGMSLTLIEAEIASEVLSQALRRDRLGARQLRSYDRRRHRRARDLTWLTRIVLWGIRRRRLARRVVTNLGRHPELFERVLAVNVDQASLGSIGLGGLRQLVVGW